MYHYRCSKKGCRKRVSKRKPIEEYVQDRHKRCPSCKRLSLRHDPKVKEQIKRDTCKCDGFPYPHKAKSISGEYCCNKASYEERARHEFDNQQEDF